MSIAIHPYIDLHSHHAPLETDEVIRLSSFRPQDAPPESGRYSIGLHPWYAEDLTDEALARIKQRLEVEKSHIWAIGEAGLDRMARTNYEDQYQYFLRQIQLSEELRIPLVIHCVRAWGELLELRRQFARSSDARWVIHGYRKGRNLAEQLLNAGFDLSLGQYFDAEAMRLAYRYGRLWLETDEADVSISELYSRASHILEIEVSELRASLYQQFQHLS